ncbi:MAG: hypothetical protein LBR22_08610 [Desulfovibrio sp.]|jgi:predicted dienelactone hydrolase|nr:hypothetical protein [Desulfovibrio sp.]
MKAHKVRTYSTAIGTICVSLLLLTCVPFLPADLQAAAYNYNVGFRTIGQWPVINGRGLDINVWYPSTSPHRTLSYPPWEITAARGGRLVEGRFPLLILSHDSPANRFAYHDTAAWLASLGFVVAAPEHARDCMDNMADLFGWEQLQDRVDELRTTIDLLLVHPDLSAAIAPQRIALLGYGAGAAAALLLGGAMPDCEGWKGYCESAAPGDMYCNAWARERITGMCAVFPLTRSLADQRVKTVAAIATGFPMIFGASSFDYYYPPTLVVGAQADQNRVQALAGTIGDGAQFSLIPGANSGSFLATCPDVLAQELPELCHSVDESDRWRIHRSLNLILNEFFLQHLRSDDNLPDIPAPPDLTPKPAPPAKTAPATPPAPHGRRHPPR